MKKTTMIIALLAIGMMFSCEPAENEDVVQKPSKDGSIETVLSVKHENSFDVLTTTQNVWIKNILEKSIVRHDTIKSLGTTIEEGENSEGETKKISVPKDYEFYITVQ